MRRLPIIIFLLVLACSQAYAQVVASPIHQHIGNYTVGPIVSSQNNSSQNLTYTGGAMFTISFWDLPLWIQIACIVQVLIGLLILIKVIPIVIGKLSNLHNNARAQKVKKFIINHPGSTMTQVSLETNINRNTVKYYIYEFISRGEILLERIGRYSLLFNRPLKYDAFEKKVFSYLHDEVNRQILWAIIENPGITNTELSGKFNLKKSTIHWYVERFLNGNIITVSKQGNFKKYFINPEAEKLIKRYYGIR